MNSEHYRNFIAIVEAGTLSAASRKLHIAQPALSNQVKSMEALFGAPLFKRNVRSMEPTEAGMILYDKAKHIILLEDAAAKEINACYKGFTGSLSLGITQAYPDPMIERLLHQFHKENHFIKFDIFELTSAEIMDLLKNGIIEIGIIRTFHQIPVYLDPLYTIPERLMVVGRKDTLWFPLKEEIDIFALKDIPLSISRGFQNTITEACLKANFTPEILSVSTSRNNALTWARNGDAVAIITADNAPVYENDTVFCRPISGDMLSRRTFAALRGRSLSNVAAKFMDFVREHSNEYKQA